MVRLFVAVNLPAEVRERIHRAAAPLRAAEPDVAWVGADRLHLTVKFLGEQPEAVVPPLVEALRAVAARHAAMPMTIAGAGAFPSLRRPRVLWAGVAPHPRLELLHHDVESACASLGHEVEGRAFRPHVTLGRVRSRIESEERRRALARAAREVRLQEEVEVETVDLMRSELAAGGSRYTVVAAAPLRRA